MSQPIPGGPTFFFPLSPIQDFLTAGEKDDGLCWPERALPLPSGSINNKFNPYQSPLSR